MLFKLFKTCVYTIHHVLLHDLEESSLFSLYTRF